MSLVDSILVGIELPLAVVDFTGTLLVCVWKTVGLSWLPGWDVMFGAVGEGSQYPIRNYGQWASWVHLLYLGLYGILGSYAQYGSLRLALQHQETSVSAKKYAKTLGLFHLILAVHHLAWSMSSSWGRLDLSQDFAIPYGKFAIGLGSLWSGVIAWDLLTNPFSDDNQKLRQQKRLLDAASFISMIPTFVFLPVNWFGYRNHALETVMWAVVPYGVLSLFVLDAITATKATTKDGSGGKKTA